MIDAKIIVCSLMFFVVATATADCIYCGASTHTSDFCNKQPNKSSMNSGRTGSGKLVLINGRWIDPAANLPEDKSVCSNCGGTHATINCPSPRKSRRVNQDAPSSEATPSVGNDAAHQKELAEWKEKKRQEAATRNQSQMIQNAGQQVASLQEQNEELELKTKALKKQVLELMEQAAWYEKYARSLHKQVGFNPAEFKVFQKSE